jgi:hypothetical protein
MVDMGEIWSGRLARDAGDFSRSTGNMGDATTQFRHREPAESMQRI